MSDAFPQVDNAVIAAHLDNPAVAALLGVLQYRGIQFSAAEGGWLVTLYGNDAAYEKPQHRAVLRMNLITALQEKWANDRDRDVADAQYRAHAAGATGRTFVTALCEGYYSAESHTAAAGAVAAEWARAYWQPAK